MSVFSCWSHFRGKAVNVRQSPIKSCPSPHLPTPTPPRAAMTVPGKQSALPFLFRKTLYIGGRKDSLALSVLIWWPLATLYLLQISAARGGRFPKEEARSHACTPFSSGVTPLHGHAQVACMTVISLLLLRVNYIFKSCSFVCVQV